MERRTRARRSMRSSGWSIALVAAAASSGGASTTTTMVCSFIFPSSTLPLSPSSSSSASWSSSPQFGIPKRKYYQQRRTKSVNNLHQLNTEVDDDNDDIINQLGSKEPWRSLDDSQPKHNVRLLLIDHYDSFTYNLVDMLSQLTVEPPVVLAKDAPSLDVETMKQYDGIVLSPGPGWPHTQPSLP